MHNILYPDDASKKAPFKDCLQEERRAQYWCRSCPQTGQSVKEREVKNLEQKEDEAVARVGSASAV